MVCDQTIKLTVPATAKTYPDKLRRVKYRDPETNKVLAFLTNNFELPAKTIADIYKQRWQVELFFKWIKQNLRIKTFYGTSENAVKNQIWIAVKRVPHGCHYQKEAEHRGKSLHNSTDSKRIGI